VRFQIPSDITLTSPRDLSPAFAEALRLDAEERAHLADTFSYCQTKPFIVE
jgi:hypothetical protein